MQVAVLGAGAWGTALAIALAERHTVLLWARDQQQVALINQQRVNERYLPGITLPQNVVVTTQLADAVTGAALVVIATPTSALRTTAQAVCALLNQDTPLVWLCKGLEQDTHLLAHQVITDVLGTHIAGPLSGPSFAQEVATGQPTALVVAGAPDFCEYVTQIVHSHSLRIYSSNDVVGVEVGGAVKNVLAIATGIADALGLGANARTALITRGLAEISRFGTALGARAETFMGLTGVGDLILTCTGDLSRNRKIGLLLGHGLPLDAALAQLGHVAEGVWSAPAVAARAIQLGVDMPLTAAVCSVLQAQATPQQAMRTLLARHPKRESL